MAYRRDLKPLFRAVTVMAIVGIIVTGVTFAALQSQQAVLTGNTIETATADLKVSKDGTNYSGTVAGFDFANVIPGGNPVPAAGDAFYLENAGSTPLTLKLAVSSTPTNADSVDLAKVSVILTTVGSGQQAQTFTLQDLIDGYATGGVAVNGNLPAGGSQEYKLQISMAADAFSGSSASLGSIDFAFSGTATN